MENISHMTTYRVSVAKVSLSERLTAAVLSLSFGLTLLWGVGIAGAEQLHNAAHDTRHAIGFPCH
jgi:cobalt transporter subunit CbtB